ncbi:TPA: hypothetical protein DDZ86_02720 [Candidatus Dependentiae bacterium]|nr:MAG: hypothetical protein UW09_C0001G0104 [candidate division TM6 bacterium GW2011_GWF2_43_87]HBL98532.1 hypothetical protein [Candidatus Dependentiae bacterium]
MNSRSFLNTLLLISVLTILPSCSLFKKGEPKPASDIGETVVTINGKVAVGANEFHYATSSIIQQQPMLEQALAMMPRKQLSEIYTQIAKGLADAFMISEYVRSQGWDKSPEYVKKAQRAHELMDRDLMVQEFSKRLFDGIVIDEKAAEEFYTKNMATHMAFRRAPFLAEPEGIEAVAVKVASNEEAKALAEKARRSSLKAAAAESKKELINMGVVSHQSMGPDMMVIQKVMGMKTLPAIEVVQGMDKKSYYVVQGLGKKTAKYAPFAQVKDDVKKIMAGEKFQEENKKKLDELHAQYKITINDAFIESLIKNAPEGSEPTAEEGEAAVAA